MVDLTGLEDEQPGAQRRVQVDGALVRGETGAPEPAMLRALLHGLQHLDVDASEAAARRSDASDAAARRSAPAMT